MRRGKRTLSYRAILLMVATLVLLLDIVLAAVIYRHYISPSYSKNLQARMREAFSQVAADPTGSQTALLRENFHVLVLRENGQLVTANVEPRQEDLENLRRTVDRAVVQPVFQTTGSDTEGELSLLGRSGGYYIEVSTQLDPIFSVAMTFTRYSIATGVIVWFATLLLVVAIERQLFQPIGEAVQVAKRIARQDFSQKCGTGGIARQSRALAESLNEMSDQLQSALSQLRQANAQLQDDIRAIERSESAMKHLIGNLSHDLKTPLALISGYAEGLSAGMAKTPEWPRRRTSSRSTAALFWMRPSGCARLSRGCCSFHSWRAGRCSWSWSASTLPGCWKIPSTSFPWRWKRQASPWSGRSRPSYGR